MLFLESDSRLPDAGARTEYRSKSFRANYLLAPQSFFFFFSDDQKHRLSVLIPNAINSLITRRMNRVKNPIKLGINSLKTGIRRQKQKANRKRKQNHNSRSLKCLSYSLFHFLITGSSRSGITTPLSDSSIAPRSCKWSAQKSSIRQSSSHPKVSDIHSSCYLPHLQLYTPVSNVVDILHRCENTPKRKTRGKCGDNQFPTSAIYLLLLISLSCLLFRHFSRYVKRLAPLKRRLCSEVAFIPTSTVHASFHSRSSYSLQHFLPFPLTAETRYVSSSKHIYHRSLS